MRITSIILIGFILISMSPTAAHGDYINIDYCIGEINTLVEREHRIFRSVLFGNRSAEKASVGTVQYTTDGKPWYKTQVDTWETEDKDADSISDEEINTNSEITAEFGTPERRGIFETKRMTTSELLPYVGNSLRALQCRLATICETVALSKTQEGTQPVMLSVAPESCIEVERFSIPYCHINNRGPVSNNIVLLDNCENTMQQLLKQEAALLTAAVQYDAAYRSLLQIAGNIDLFMQEFTFPVHTTLENVTDIIQSFSRLPCFLSSCDASPPPQ